MLLAAPELFYLGLVYTPSVIAICFVLAAHVLLRHLIRAGGLRILDRSSSRVRIALSLVLFGIGASVHWDIVAYGAVPVDHPQAKNPGGHKDDHS